MIKVNTNQLKFVLESHNTTSGTPYFLVTCNGGTFRFTKLDSVLDFINHNDFGYVSDK